ncbi:carboxypeptidase S, partial [Zopfochytrium polystomum]
ASCAQELPLAPSSHPALDQVFASYYDGSNTSFTDALAQKLSGMVRIQTVSFDDMKTRPVEEPLPDDPRRLGLYELRSYLKATWPQLHSKLELDIVNRYSLVYTWKGSDPSLKPLLLAAHQDTVPVPSDTVDRWTYPPFDGIIADGRIWGRGTSDCKGQLAAILEAAENLVINGFQPRRTLVLAFGFDEEISGIQGAAIMAEYFESIYGVNGIAMIVDEGTGLEEAFGTTFAYLAISEKGAVSVRFSVSTPGGHASVPPAHTGIGILSLLVVNLEANPFPLSLGTDENESPLLQQLRCEAAHAPLMPNDLRETISRVDRSVGAEKDEAKRELANKLAVDPIYKAVMSTTQAVDLISGGIKVNALPELATATANYRIAADSSIAKTEDRLFQLTKSVAAAFNMTLTQKILCRRRQRRIRTGTIRIVSESAPMEPSRKTPVDGKPYKVMAGTVLHALKRENEPLFVSPSSPTFNTDTRFYHRLSEHIFRFSPPRSRASQRMHTVDENLVAVDLVASSGFFFDLIRNADEAQL